MSNGTGPSGIARNPNGANELSALQRAIAALEKMKARLDAVETAANEPIAVVGMGCRFPGGGEGPDAFWNVLENGRDAIKEISPSRWQSTDISGDRNEARWAGLLDDLSQFDAAFFGISPREAESLDPQQRILLEVAWEALEDGGLRADLLFESRTGVFIGICGNDYHLLVGDARQGKYDAYCVTGNMYSTAAGRISFVFGFQGPAVSIDTACSSSLVSISQACQSLRARDSDVAIAGGVNAIISARMMEIFLETQALASDGRCKTLDARASGFVRGEGCGIVILKRLSDALRDGDRIRGLIRGWAVNQDGRSTGLTTPNVLSQQAMLRQALARAQLVPEDIGYVEMHGTGTSLGDPIEAEALREVLGVPRRDGSSCVLGAVKTNVGHLEGAAGVAGFIKVLLALEHEQIPKNLHFRQLNPRISLGGTPFVVPTEPISWPRKAKIRRAGVSAFGISGTNAHVILEESPAQPAVPPAGISSAHVLPISAKSPQALSALVASYAQWFSSSAARTSLRDIAYTASARRTHHAHRCAITARTHEEFADLLRTQARQLEATTSNTGAASRSQAAPKIVFVFPGQGSQWTGMGRQLFDEEPVFRETLEACEPLIHKEAGFSVIAHLRADDSQAEQSSIAIIQPVLFAIEIALATLWRSWGIVPDCVVGHSMGEVAAAFIAGMLSLEDAVKVICRRSRLLKRISGQGAMALIELPFSDAEAAIAGYENELGIAASNGPRSTIIAGNPSALDHVLSTLETNGVFCRRVKVDVASHSPQVQPLRDGLLDALRDLQPHGGTLPMRSTVTGNPLQGAELSPNYWFENLRRPVRFSSVIQDLLRDGHSLFLEMSPHPILLPSIEETLAANKAQGMALASTRRQTDERRTMLETLGSLYTNGVNIDWAKLHRDRGTVVSLPSYPWQRERFWVETPRQTKHTRGHGVHPLLGIQFDSSIAPGEHVWQQSVSVHSLPYLADHCVQNEVVFPGAAYVEIAIAATSAVYNGSLVVIDEMSLDQMLALAPGAERQIQVVLQKDEQEFAGIAISSRGEGEESWIRHGTIRVRSENGPRPNWEAGRGIENRCRQRMDSDAHYAKMNTRGLLYGDTFRGVEEVFLGAGEAFGRVSMPAPLVSELAEYRFHPALLDACLQVASWAIISKVGNALFVPREFIGLKYYARPSRHLRVYGRLNDMTKTDAISVEIVVCDENGALLLEIQEMRIALVDAQTPTATKPLDDLLFQLAWRSKTLPLQTRATAGGAWLVLVDAQGIGAAVADHLRSRGEACIEAHADSTYRALGNDKYRLDATDPSHIKRLLEEAFKSGQKCKGVAHFLSLDAALWDQTTSKTLAIDVRRSCLSTLRLTQALLVQGWRDVPRLYLFTRGVHCVVENDASAAVAQAGIWGLGRTIALEHPALQCTRVDLSPQSSVNETESIVREILAADKEDQVALRQTDRFVARMVHDTIAAKTPREFVFHSDRSYLITGGLSGLGLELALWMVNQGARHLVLVGRSAPSAYAMESIANMVQIGAKVRVVAADISKYDDVERLLSIQRHELPPLAGIAHAAVALEDRTILDLSEDAFLRVMGAKVFGAFYLHTLTADESLDFFLLYSSVAGSLGSPGQSNYAAANTMVDAIARARVASGRPAMSIAWGPFTDIGLAAAQENRGKRLADRGIRGISPATGHALVANLLARPRATVAAMHLAVRQWEESFPQGASLPLLEELRRDTDVANETGDAAQSLRRELESSAPDRQFDLLRTHVLEQLGRVLRIDPKRIDASATFISFGVDSLMSLELRNRLQASLGIDFRATLLFTYPTTDKLVTFLAQQLRPEQPTAQSTISDTPGLPDTNATQNDLMSDMSADALLAMLDEELSATKKGG